jgi:hypothetical protein
MAIFWWALPPVRTHRASTDPRKKQKPPPASAVGGAIVVALFAALVGLDHGEGTAGRVAAAGGALALTALVSIGIKRATQPIAAGRPSQAATASRIVTPGAGAVAPDGA